MDPTLSKATVQIAEKLFLSPTPQYGWAQIIRGVQVSFRGGHSETRDAVGNSFRGFHRVDKTIPGAKSTYDSFFLKNQEALRSELTQVTSTSELHRISDSWRSQIVQSLTNTKPSQLTSYGRTRKPIDLYVMNLVALAKEMAVVRTRLVPLLFLPLDGEMFQKAFTAEELRAHGLSRSSKYGEVKTEKTYLSLQEIIKKRARHLTSEMEIDVRPIYFEMMWRERLDAQAGNIFSASPMRNA